jgi:hypothetical protein
MWRHPALALILIAYVAWGAWNWFIGRPVYPQDGVLAAAEPLQVDTTDGEQTRLGHWTLTTRASYHITARILGLERYRFDQLADLIPEDLALGWGPMSDNRIISHLDIYQSDRFYFWHANTAPPISRDSIIVHSANTHVIPQDATIAKQLSRLRPGEVVTLSGDLVDAVRDDGARIKTSLVRTDTGAGACEVMLVRDVELLP